MVERLERRLAAELAGIGPRSSSLPVFSSVTGEAADTACWDAAYWYRNLRRPVVFDRALGAALAGGCRVVVEVGPHPVLISAVQDVLDARGPAAGVVVGTLRRGEGDLRRCWLRWRRSGCTGFRWTGRRCSPGAGRGGWTCPHTPSSTNGTGRNGCSPRMRGPGPLAMRGPGASRSDA
jgi:acyl transferase domain-containing protein